MGVFTEILTKVSDFVWGGPLIAIIMVLGIYLTFRLRLVQIIRLPRAVKYTFRKEEGAGEVSNFGALCAALSATIGTGNIVGVATAVGIMAGGPGALFWMWIAAFLGMAIKYSEAFLAVKYRQIDSEGHVLGGPFYYIETGMGFEWKWLAKAFAFFGACAALLGIGTITQIHGMATAMQSFFDPNNENTIKLFSKDYSVIIIITAALTALFVSLVIIGGVRRIASVSQILVPFMVILYVGMAMLLIVTNADKLPAAFSAIINGAFGLKAVSGGMLSSIAIAMRVGISRGVFSNEAGLGSTSIVVAAAKSKEPVHQGLVAMLDTFIDTIIICTMTGLCIVMMGTWKNGSLEGIQIATLAFEKGLGFLSVDIIRIIIMICLVFFAFTTIFGWNYYGERCVEYFTKKNKKAVRWYRILYILAIFIGPYMTVKAVWTIADIFNALMVLPNLIAVTGLSGIVVRETQAYFRRDK